MSGTLPVYNASGDGRGRADDPLKRFSDAKNQMKIIFDSLHNCVVGLEQFYAMETSKFVPGIVVDEVQRFKDSIRTIQRMFTRDKMKVVFFGRTSNGKSTVINAMLHSKVLPQGMGHTTACFLQVEGSGENDKYLQIETSNDKLPVSEIYSLGNALSSGNSKSSSLGTNSLVTVHYPKASSKLLRNDVVLVDSPGVDLSPEFDKWIDKHCLDADVFVLVCNSESTLTQAEKNFFVRVSEKLSRPSVFILNNRWDASAGESDQDIEKVRAQHMQRFKAFLVDELRSCDERECTNRIFFISAREVLEARLKEKNELKRAYEENGHERRAKEFASFEQNFERCISKAAIRTKFQAHTGRAYEIIDNIVESLNNVTNIARNEQSRLKLDLELKNRQFAECRKQYAIFEEYYRDQQSRIGQEVSLKVSADFHEEIDRLASIIDRFNLPFDDTAEKVAYYKDQLAIYVDKAIKEDLNDKCSGALMARIWALENDLYNRVSEIVGADYVKDLQQVMEYKNPFAFTVTIETPVLMGDFREDLEFKFSLGLSSLIRTAIAFTLGKPVTSIGKDHLAALHGRAQNAIANPVNAQSILNDQMISLVVTTTTTVANSGVGLIVVGFLVYKNVDWKVIGGGTALYSGLYFLERFRWNTAAKEQHLKNQFRQHLALKMAGVGNVHTKQCEQQVLNELDGFYRNMRKIVAGVHQEMKHSLDSIKQSVEGLDGFLKGIVAIKNKTHFLNTSLEAFSTKFLAPDSPIF